MYVGVAFRWSRIPIPAKAGNLVMDDPNTWDDENQSKFASDLSLTIPKKYLSRECITILHRRMVCKAEETDYAHTVSWKMIGKGESTKR